MFRKLQKNNITPITLGELRKFINDDCSDLPDDTIIEVHDTNKNESVSKSVAILADESSIEFYPFI